MLAEVGTALWLPMTCAMKSINVLPFTPEAYLLVTFSSLKFMCGEVS